MLGLSTDEFVRLATAGGGFTLDAQTIQVADLMRIATAASSKGARVRIQNAHLIPVNDLVRIAVAGGRCNIFRRLKHTRRFFQNRQLCDIHM
jgi:hypothetical protein